MADPPVKRYRRDPSPKSEDSEEDDSYVPYVSVKERRRQQLVKLGKISETDAKTRVEALKEDEHLSSGTNSDHDENRVGSPSKETEEVIAKLNGGKRANFSKVF